MSPTIGNENASATRPGVVTGAAAVDLSALVTRVAGGDREALGELYDATVARLFAVARLILRNSADAEEIVCDVYTQVWESAAQYRGDRGAVLAWLVMICRSRSLDRIRRNRIRLHAADQLPDQNEPSPQPGPEELLDIVQHGTAVHRALQSLSPMRRQLVSLAFLRGLSHLEISEECGLPVGTVKSHIRRALSALREQLAEGGAHVPSSS